MADETANSKDTARRVVDLQSDERWEERLSDARERRAQALKEQGRDEGATRKPRKPWEEEASEAGQSADKAPTKIKTKYDFLDRVNAIKRVTGQGNADEIDPPGQEPQPGKNWYPGAGDKSDAAAPVAAAPEVASQQGPKIEQSIDEHQTSTHASADELFNGPEFASKRIDEPVSLLLQNSEISPPSSASRPWLLQKVEVEETFLVPPDATLSIRSNENTRETKKRYLPRWLGIALMFLIAVGVGPLMVFSPWQTRATGPAPPFFGFIPALGLTSPLAGLPSDVSTTDLRLAVDAPIGGPAGSSKDLPPDFLRVITSFAAPPDIGATTAGVDLPSPTGAGPAVPRISPIAPQMTLLNFQHISGDVTRLVTLPPVLASISYEAIKPVPRPDGLPLTQ